MDSKFYVSLKAAILLRDKGYDINRDYLTPVYKDDGGLYWSNHEDLSDKIPAITKDEAIHWIECNYYLRISVIYVDEELYEYEVYDLNSGISTSGFASSRLDAENEVIIRSLELISSPTDNGV